MIEETYVRNATVRKVVDGDTIEVVVDMGFRRYSVERLRVSRINTPEVRGEQRIEGLASKDFVVKLLPEGTKIVIQSSKGDAFGRWIAEVYYIDGATNEQVNLSDLLLSKGLAKVYEG